MQVDVHFGSRVLQCIIPEAVHFVFLHELHDADGSVSVFQGLVAEALVLIPIASAAPSITIHSETERRIALSASALPPLSAVALIESNDPSAVSGMGKAFTMRGMYVTTASITDF